MTKSKLHIAVGEVISSSIFKGFVVQEEVLVRSISPEFHNARARFDWVIFGPDIVIEAHGRQHYEVASFGRNAEESLMALHEQKDMDFKKRIAAEDAGFTYIEVPYTDIEILDNKYLVKKYQENRNMNMRIEALDKKPEENYDRTVNKFFEVKSEYYQNMKREKNKRRRQTYKWLKDKRHEKVKPK